MSDGIGKVLIHRAMSLDGFIAGPEHEMDWIFDYTAPAQATRSWPPRAPC